MRAIYVTFVASVMALTGCVDDIEYVRYLDDLPVVQREHAGEAIGIVADLYGVDHRAFDVVWVDQPEPIKAEPYGASGITIGCKSWVWWDPRRPEDPRTSRTFHGTSMAHEMAHCAMGLYGIDGDADHSNLTWWGATQEGGLVGQANKALEEAGL